MPAPIRSNPRRTANHSDVPVNGSVAARPMRPVADRMPWDSPSLADDDSLCPAAGEDPGSEPGRAGGCCSEVVVV
jgi:hypothetical protein